MHARTLAGVIRAIVAAAALAGAFAASADTLLIENVTLIDGTGRPGPAGAGDPVGKLTISVFSTLESRTDSGGE